MKKHVVAGSVALVVLLGIGATVWPTPWRYDEIVIGGSYSAQRRFVRTSRLTGQSEYLTDYGWTPMTVQYYNSVGLPVAPLPSPSDGPYSDITDPKR